MGFTAVAVHGKAAFRCWQRNLTNYAHLLFGKLLEQGQTSVGSKSESNQSGLRKKPKAAHPIFEKSPLLMGQLISRPFTLASNEICLHCKFKKQLRFPRTCFRNSIAVFRADSAAKSEKIHRTALPTGGDRLIDSCSVIVSFISILIHWFRLLIYLIGQRFDSSSKI